MADQAMQIPSSALHIGRVVGEDDDLLFLEVAKDRDFTFELSNYADMNRFLTVMFVRQDDDGAQIWTPWEDRR